MMARGYPTFRRRMGLRDFKASEMQRMSDASQRFDNMHVSPPLYIKRTASGVRIGMRAKRITARAAIIGDVVPFYIVGMDKDFLLGEPPDGGETVKIAKPYKLRWKPFNRRPPINLITYKYFTRADGSDFGLIFRIALGPQTLGFPQESHVVIEPYLVRPNGLDGLGDLIFAVKTDVRLGLSADPPEGEVIPDVEWLDLNADGRAWAAEDSPQGAVATPG